MPERVTPAAEEPFVDPAGDTQAGPDVPTPTSVAAATEAPAQPITQAEVTLDLGADPSGPDTRDAGQTLAQPALRTGDTDLSAVEVVKILAPSVVQIANESIAIGAFNRPFPVEGVGTGVIIDAAGHILTSSHLVERVQSITVVLSTGERYEARVVGTDPTTDTSVIAIDAEGLQPAKLGVSADLEGRRGSDLNRSRARPERRAVRQQGGGERPGKVRTARKSHSRRPGPDGCVHQSRQQRRPACQHAGGGRGHQCRDHSGQPGHRLRHQHRRYQGGPRPN